MQWKDVKGAYVGKVAKLASQLPHEILGVARDAPLAEIKSAHRKLVKAYHPDGSDPFLSNHNEEMLKVINAAYDRLREGR